MEHPIGRLASPRIIQHSNWALNFSIFALVTTARQRIYFISLILSLICTRRKQQGENNLSIKEGILWIAAERGYSEKKPMVLLIDALDRAPAGFLEDLLLELDLLSFTVSETAERVEFSQEYGPIVFLAGNNLDKIDPYIKGQCLSYVVPASLSRPMEAILPNRKSTVFISYAHEDSDTASRIYSDLKNRGIGVWLDSQDLLPGQKWEVEIKKVMRSCTYVIALLSDNSVSKKGFVQKELKFALDLLDEVPADDVFVIPVRITKCIPNDERLQTLHWADLFQDYDNGLDKILRVLESKNRTREAQQ